MKKNIIVALTGQSGAGKTSVSDFFKKKGFPVIDCDEIAKEIHSDAECQRKLCMFFGDDILKDGAVDKRLLSQKAFANPQNLQMLTEITHPFIINKILSIADNYFKNGNNIVIVDGAVIIGHDFERYCDKFIVVLCDRNKQYKRLMARDNITLQQAKNRIDKQTRLEKMLAKADYIIYNNDSIEHMHSQAEYIISKLNKLQ